MTVNEFLTARVRPLIGDEDGSTWTNGDLVDKVNIGRIKLFADEPAAFSVSAVVLAVPDDLTLSGTIDIASPYYQALAHYVAYLCFAEDSQDEANGRLAADHFAKYGMEVV